MTYGKYLSSLLLGCVAALAMAMAGCGADAGVFETGNVELSLLVGEASVDRVNYEVTGGSLVTPLSGELAVEGNVVSATISNIPEGIGYLLSLTAYAQGEKLCEGVSESFDIVAGETTQVDVTLNCGVAVPQPSGNAQVNGSFEIVQGNACPLLHSVSAIPLQNAAGAQLEIVASDPDGSELSYSWTASAGSFDDPSSSKPVYLCGPATGPQSISVLLSDGTSSCDVVAAVEVDCGFESFPGELSADMQCNNALAIGMHELEAHIKVDPPLGTGGAVQEAVLRDPSVLFREMFGRLFLSLGGSDLIQLERLTIEVAVEGGTPATITIEAGPSVFDVDLDDDGIAEDVWLEIPFADLAVSSDGSSSMEFSIVAIEVRIGGAPVVGHLVLTSEPIDEANAATCSLLGQAVSFAVN